MWFVSGALLLIWFVLKFVLHKSGYIHMLLLAGVSLFVVQLAAYRKTKYQRDASKR
jgi:hypothetical protein